MFTKKLYRPLTISLSARFFVINIISKNHAKMYD